MILIARTSLIFAILSATMLINQDDNLLARIGMNGNYALLAAVALISAVLLSSRPSTTVAAAALLSLAANAPIEYIIGIGLNRDYYAAFLMVLLVQPIASRLA